MVIATAISTVLAAFYLYFGWQAYFAIVAGAIYNMGVNSHIVLWSGAYVKTPIDLNYNFLNRKFILNHDDRQVGGREPSSLLRQADHHPSQKQ